MCPELFSCEYIPTDTGGADVHTNLTGPWLRIRFLNEMDFVLRVVESGYIGGPGGFLAIRQYLKFRMVQSLARMVRLSVVRAVDLIDLHDGKR
jgi:hypothetical protein